MNNTYEECILACLDCIKACNTCYGACLNEEDVKMMVPCIRMDRECTDNRRPLNSAYSHLGF